MGLFSDKFPMMPSLARYVARSPRYILQPHDNTLVRVAGPHQTPWEEGTEIHNVSLSGLAFTAPADLAPVIGEIIKIQFAVPGKEDMACLALVIRIQKQSSSTFLIAVKFIKLEMPQRLLLAQALARKLKDQIDRSSPERKSSWLESKKTRLLLSAGFALLWLLLLKYFWL